MRPDERQAAIWDIIFQRRYETVPNLAHELGVCIRTVYGDLSEMKEMYPIETVSGKYGGVYLIRKPHNTQKHLTPIQERILRELLTSQPIEIQSVLQSILDAFARKHP